MFRPSFSLILSGLFIAYVLHSIYGIASLFLPPNCEIGPGAPSKNCLTSFLASKPKLQLVLATTSKSKIKYFSDLELIGQWRLPKLRNTKEFGVGDSIFRDNISIPINPITRKNGTLFIHAFLTEEPRDSSDPGHSNWINLVQQQTTMSCSFQLTEYLVPEAKTFNLLNSNTPQDSSGSGTGKRNPPKSSTPIAHLSKKVRLVLLTQPYSLPTQNLPEDLFYLIRILRSDTYLPPFRFDKLSSRLRDFFPINSTDELVELELEFEAESIGKLRLGAQFEQAMESMRALGFQPKDLDEVKAIFSDTNVWLLGLTFFVASVHILFDFLAFKNDVTYWKNRKTVVGLSSRTILWRCFSQIVIFLYLLEEKSSLLITVPGGIGVIIEAWKVTKAYKLTLSFPNHNFIPKLSFGSMSESEKATAKFDGESMKYLSYLMYPLLLGGAGWSLLYTPHKSWYSWTLQSLVNGVYAFGFLFMLPQLFVNYRLKSVAHLPWRAFMYKAFNTFIDDLFAFIITMPVAHRMACFRDDIVFLIYLYQRWLYPVDKTRLDAGGEYELELEEPPATQGSEDKKHQ